MNPLALLGIKAGATLALVLAVWWAIGAVPAHYIAEGRRLETADRAVADKAHLAKDTADILERERVAAALKAANDADRLKREQDHANEIAAIVDRARAGRSGMRCPAIGLQPNTTPAAATPVGGPGDADGQYLVPAAAGDILDIAAGIAAGVRRYNDLLAEDAAVRAACKSEP